jgi:hypothetical protein
MAKVVAPKPPKPKSQAALKREKKAFDLIYKTLKSLMPSRIEHKADIDELLKKGEDAAKAGEIPETGENSLEKIRELAEKQYEYMYDQIEFIKRSNSDMKARGVPTEVPTWRTGHTPSDPRTLKQKDHYGSDESVGRRRYEIVE